MSKIYRFVSFETFVDMLMKQSLTFVHPSLWDDPYELKFIESKIKKTIDSGSYSKENTVETIILNIMKHKLYCQSWTKLDESDALWRIYNHNNTSVRIEVDLNDISKLKNVEALEVEYLDDPYQMVEKVPFYDLIRIKRKAFSHEQELRLVTHYKFNGAEDVKEYVKDFLKLSGNSKFYKNIESEKIPDEVARIISKLNLNLKDKTYQVCYGHIDNFIKSVMLNPFAPEWFNDTLKMFCETYGINYLGKSQLYAQISN
ncbi:hypothetical protein [Bacillus inaquosorum]|uniref:hypothetical protein n=1 Tax=Bacillus inaquosorum TaxID=483913 RepID=UPI0022821718|nr:hypothetical protein [Bacillus inaquosorum]MCY9457352.1 hypothetical protein [Bacillus inaquosorum]